MKGITALLVGLLLLIASCQPAQTRMPTPTVMVIPPTATAALSPTVTLTVKFTEKGCTYDGPQSISYSKFTVQWIVDDPKHNKIALVILTLARGKTIDDLRACVCTDAEIVDWIQGLWLDQENAFGPELEETHTYVHEYDLTSQAKYHGEPLYMFCGNEEGKTSSLGPIAVAK